MLLCELEAVGQGEQLIMYNWRLVESNLMPRVYIYSTNCEPIQRPVIKMNMKHDFDGIFFLAWNDHPKMHMNIFIVVFRTRLIGLRAFETKKLLR